MKLYLNNIYSAFCQHSVYTTIFIAYRGSKLTGKTKQILSSTSVFNTDNNNNKKKKKKKKCFLSIKSAY